VIDIGVAEAVAIKIKVRSTSCPRRISRNCAWVSLNRSKIVFGKEISVGSALVAMNLVDGRPSLTTIVQQPPP